ncbi:hypothetical protein [uncultured Kordia sp.]|uniref:hypothetical protein n=1 Tax=uncultured Kordia sp. TaxID=507699 RepID=UPI002629B1E6|nr:hypothetical protein [uncultured Kordia sp.]
MTATTEEVQPKKLTLLQKILPLALLLFNIYLFFELIPDHIAEAYSILLSIVGGVITVILSFWVAGTLLRSLLKYMAIPIFLLCIASLFIFGICFIWKTTSYSSNELAENGVYTTAIVQSKSRMYGRRGRTIQSIEVLFLDEHKQKQSATIDIGKNEYNSFNKGMIIPIFYSSEHPNIARISYKKLRSGDY